MKYQNKNDLSIFAKDLDYDSKTKSYLMVYLSGPKTGKTFNLSSSTVKRWWKKVTDDEVEEYLLADEGDLTQFKVEREADVSLKPVTKEAYMQSLIESKDFNNPKEKKFIPEPECIRKAFLGNTGVEFPEVHKVADLMVSWGASITEYPKYIKMSNGTKILFRRNVLNCSKSLIEVRMKEEVAVRADGFLVERKDSNAALIKRLPFTAYIDSIDNLKALIERII